MDTTYYVGGYGGRNGAWEGGPRTINFRLSYNF